ncbi:MAG: hypothetical protein U0X39_02135 [Bacteroidales bacterium]
MATLGKDVAGTKGPDIGFIWVERANPVLQIPDSNAVKEALKDLDSRSLLTSSLLTRPDLQM